MTVCQAEIHPDCTGIAAHRHHRQLRRHRNDTPENLLDVCLYCHAWIHANVATSYTLGLMVHSWDDPGKVPVRL